MNAPVLSVVIPAYNEERRLPGTLRSVVEHLRPRGTSFEVLVVDDGSTDGTVAVVGGFADPAVRLVRSPMNRGKGHAVRTGMLAAAGVLKGRLATACAAGLGKAGAAPYQDAPPIGCEG